MNEKIDEINYKIMQIDKVFDEALCAPVFRPHHLYCRNKFRDSVPYISYKDVLDKKIIIRARNGEAYQPFDQEEREVIVKYDTISELVSDGWELD